MTPLAHFRRLARARAGVAAIETAAIAPALILLSLGSFQVSAMVARKDELQTAAAEGVAIALATTPTTSADLTSIKNVVMTSAKLDSSSVTVSYLFRCGTGAKTTDQTTCGTGVRAWRSMRIRMTALYTPIWARFGVGAPVPITVDRTVLLG